MSLFFSFAVLFGKNFKFLKDDMDGNIKVIFLFSAPLRSKGRAYAIPPVCCLLAFARAHAQNVQFLPLGQFLSNYKG